LRGDLKIEVEEGKEDKVKFIQGRCKMLKRKASLEAGTKLTCAAKSLERRPYGIKKRGRNAKGYVLDN